MGKEEKLFFRHKPVVSGISQYPEAATVTDEPS
jgi:hypothetical protein